MSQRWGLRGLRRGMRPGAVLLHSASCWLGALSLCLLVGGCDRSLDKQIEPLRWMDEPEKRAEGPRVEDRDFVLDVGAPWICETPGVLAPKEGWTRLTVPFALEATTRREVPVSPLSFALQDKEGHRFSPTLAGCLPAFDPRKLSTGDKLEAHLAFDVPSPEAHFDLLFEPFLIGRKPVSVRAELPHLKRETPQP